MLRAPCHAALGTVRCIRCSSYLYKRGESLNHSVTIAPKRFYRIQQHNHQLYHDFTENNNFGDLQRIVSLSDDLIHKNLTVPLNRVKVVSFERCFRFLARYLANIQTGVTRPIQTPNGIINEDRINTIVSHLWKRLQSDAKSRSDAIISGRIYSHTIDMLARLGQAEEAEQILKEMIQWTYHHPSTLKNHDKHDEFNSLHSALFSSVINAYAKIEITSSTALHERRRRDWNSPTRKCGLKQAEALLQYQLQLYHQWNKPLKMKPNVICFTALINAYARRGDVTKAEELLSDLLQYDIRATTMTFNVIIAAWSRASTHESMKSIEIIDHLPARKAEQVLLTMEQRSHGHARPDVISFSTGKLAFLYF